MSFATKVAALRRFLGVPENLEMLGAVAAMNAMMGVVGEGALPAQVDALVAATGVEVRAIPSPARVRSNAAGQIPINDG